MSNHDKMQLFLMVQYVILGLIAFSEKSYGKSIYWLGAIVLSVGLLMQRG